MTGKPIFSPDSRRIAYVVPSGGINALFLSLGSRLRVAVDGKEEREYLGIMKDTPVFSPDSKRVAYGAAITRGKTQAVILDGQEGNFYDGIEVDGGLVFSSDSKHLAYRALRHWKQVLVVDGIESKEYSMFLAGSKLIFDTPTTLHTLTGGNEVLCLDIEIS